MANMFTYVYDKCVKFISSVFHSSRTQYVIAILLTPVFLSTILVINFHNTFDMAKRIAIGNCVRRVSQASDSFNQKTVNVLSALSAASRKAEIMLREGMTTEDVEKWLFNFDSETRKKYCMNFVMFYGIANGKYFSTGVWNRAKDYDHTVRPWYKEAVENHGRIKMVTPYVDPNTKQVVMTLTTKLAHKDSVIAVDCYLSDLLSFIDLDEDKGVFKWYLMDKFGNITRCKHEKFGMWLVSEAAIDIRNHIIRSRYGIELPTSLEVDGRECALFHSQLLNDWEMIGVINQDALRNKVLKYHLTDLYLTIFITFIAWVFLTFNFLLIQRAKDKMHIAEKSKTLFFSAVSHDIRTPLNSIIGFTQLLREGKVSENQKSEYLNDIMISGNLLMNLINDMLDLSKLDAAKIKYNFEYSDFNDLVDPILATFMPTAKASENNLSAEMDSEMPYVKIDKHRNRQVLFNLISNANKFTSGGAVTVHATFVRTEKKRGNLIYKVVDTGIGISKENIKKVLDPFVQVGDGIKGTGLGLSIVTRLVSQMNGTLAIESEEGKGSAFIVTLNDVEFTNDATLLTQEESDASTMAIAQRISSIAPLHHKEGKHGKNKFLLVDDIELNLKVLSRMLSTVGKIDCVLARSGAEALEKLAKEKFDAVLTDIQMPEMDGTQLLKNIRQIESLNELKVYAISADVNFINHWSETGFDGLLLKPVTLDNITKFLVNIQG